MDFNTTSGFNSIPLLIVQKAFKEQKKEQIFETILFNKRIKEYKNGGTNKEFKKTLRIRR